MDTRCSAAGDSALGPFLALIGSGANRHKLDAIPYRRISDGKGAGQNFWTRSAPASSCLIGPRRDVSVRSAPRHYINYQASNPERSRHFGYRIQPFAYSNASMAIRATAAATPLPKKQIAATILESQGHCCASSPLTKNYLALRFVPRATDYVK